jgi:hypothetical protein
MFDYFSSDSLEIGDEEVVQQSLKHLNFTHLKLEFYINNKTGRIVVESGNIVRNITADEMKKYDGINIYNLEIKLLTWTGVNFANILRVAFFVQKLNKQFFCACN